MSNSNNLPKEHARIVAMISPWMRITLALLLCSIAGFAIYGTVNAYTMPEWGDESVALVNYQHRGEFDYLVYVEPSHLYGDYVEMPEEGAETVYFLNIIDDITVQFDYSCIADSPITDLSSDIDIVAIVTGPSNWRTEVILKSAHNGGGSVSVSFPLELDQFDELVDKIENELGLRSPYYTPANVYQLLIEARVDISGNTADGRIRDSFVQPMKIDVGQGTLEWSDELALSHRESVGGFSYKHQGSFGYTVGLKENSLYGFGVINREPYEWPPSLALEPGNVYFTRITEIMMASFDYQFISNKAVTNLDEEVEVKAILEYPGVWSKTFPLLSKTKKNGEFTVDFAVDINSFNTAANMIRSEIDIAPSSYELTIEATVHTTATTDFGNVDEVFTQSLEGTLTATAVSWSNKLESSKVGSITSTHLVLNTEKFIGLSRGEARIVFPVSVAIILPFALYLVYLLIISTSSMRPAPLSESDKEAKQAKKKHKGLIVDIPELPDMADRDIKIISLSSLSDLAATAESLFKPILHKAGEDGHTYYVIDNDIRYEYINKTEPSYEW